MADYLVQESAAGATDHLLTEAGGMFVLEDGSGDILLESSSSGGTLGKFTLEDGTGFILLEAGVTPPPEVSPGGGIIIPRRRRQIRIDRYHLEEDEAIALSLLLRTRKRLK